MEFRIERRSGVPAYRQIVEQVEQGLRLGVLREGDQLPTAKQVVERTAINPNTVLKAYRELERAGLVEPRPGLGTFVRKSLALPATDGPLRGELTRWMTDARAAGLGPDDVTALFTAVRDNVFASADPARTHR